jgi:hypothetical protein
MLVELGLFGRNGIGGEFLPELDESLYLKLRI